MDTSITYTNEALENNYPIYLDSLMSIEVKADVESSLGAVWSSPIMSVPIGWRFSSPIFPVSREGFIGILTDEEAESMKEDLKLFKKRFNDDFARKNKILFGR